MLILGQDRGMYTYAQTHQLGNLCMTDFAFYLYFTQACIQLFVENLWYVESCVSLITDLVTQCAVDYINSQGMLT